MPRRHAVTAACSAVLTAVSLSALPGRGVAQARLSVGVGVLAGTDLVHDSLASPVALRPNPGLVATVGFDAPLDRTYRLGLELEVSHGTLALHGDSTVAVTSLTVWHPALRLSRDLSARLAAHASLGAIFYAPSQRAGTLFQSGTTPEPAVGLGVTLRQRLSARLGVGLAVDYDVHRFTTNALTAQGFSGATTVQRVAVTLRFTRLGRATE